MKKYNIFIVKEAKEDLREIYTYISEELCEPQIAKKIRESLKSKIYSLQQFPNRNPINDEPLFKARGIRALIAERYRIFYTVNESDSSVMILRVISTRRDWQNII
ncbi:MAG: type II toxin-antitoxin system RelE/ParE family toxin [Clostridia bacterium]|nr:type II toxin-antitoxin system RelE/ParE family toxin [Clostridia bacterium]